MVSLSAIRLAWILCVQNVLALNISLNAFTREVLSGTDVLLSCAYHLEPNDTIYSLKWYKGTHEFYRHLPREKPSTTIFPWTDFPIESDGMEVGKVILRRVNAEAEGTYKCEASTEGPKFNTDSAEANLTVIELAPHDPVIVTEMPTVGSRQVGDRIRLNCSYGRSRPAAQIKWTLNKELVHDANLFVQRDGQRSAVHSILDIVLTPRHFKSQRLDITCTAAVGSHLKRKVEVQIPLPKGNQPGSAAIESQPAMAKIAGNSICDVVEERRMNFDEKRFPYYDDGRSIQQMQPDGMGRLETLLDLLDPTYFLIGLPLVFVSSCVGVGELGAERSIFSFLLALPAWILLPST